MTQLHKKILIDCSGYYFSNLGDIAMLQVAVKRVKEKYTHREIYIFTKNEISLQKYCPDTKSVDVTLRNNWFKQRIIPIPLRILPLKIRKHILRFENFTRNNFPLISRTLVKIIYKFKNEKKDKSSVEFMDILNPSSMVIVSGGGFINNYFPKHAKDVLNTLAIAQKMKIPTAMFGQGIGPLNFQELIELGKKTFPKLSTIGIRESITSLRILKETGLHQEKIFITGDDAIELVFQYQGQQIIKDCIGINIRLANYAGKLETHLEKIGDVINRVAQENEFKIIPIPIHIGDDNRDIRASERTCLIETEEVEIAKKIDTVETLIQQINRCKIVITGSYHAAVFALSSGIPVIAIAESDYYISKFAGLANQFSIGCEIVDLNLDNPYRNLIEAIQKSLNLNIKERLIEKAKDQVKKSQEAWNYFFNLVD